MKTNFSNIEINRLLRFYFLMTFGISWSLWIPMAASVREVSLSGGDGLSLALLLLGAFSPSLTGIFMTRRITDQAGWLDYWRRAIDFRKISPGWFAIILLFFPMTMALTFLIESLLGGNIPSMDGAWQTLTHPLTLLVFVISMLIGGPLAEEFGWRGFALDRMLEIWSPKGASLALGIIHAIWHLPLFFMQGTSQGAMGIGTSLFWLWVIQVVAGSFLFTLVYANNKRSILSAILIHFMSNAVFTLIAQLGDALPLRTEIIRTLLTFALVMIVVIYGESGKLSLRVDTCAA